MRLLFFGESPLNPTGFGQVNKHLAAAFAREAKVTMVASGHYYESYDRDEYPYEIIGCPLVPPEERSLEHQRNLPNIEHYLKETAWDVFVTQVDMGWWNDTVLKWAKELQEEHPERDTIYYAPIDGDVSLAHAFIPLTWFSVPCVYTNHARGVVAKHAPEIAENVSVMWLGCEPDVFYPLPDEKRRELRVRFFGDELPGRFIVLNVNRNQQRKDLMRSMAAFHVFHEKHPDSTLLLHAVMTDIGGSLPHQARLLGLDVFGKPPEIAFSNLDLANPWSRETLNELYNACDCLISTAYGEGWGLCTTEAMAAGLPVVVPYNTANIDILGNHVEGGIPEEYERGWGVRTGGDLDHTIFLYTNGNSLASTIHTESFVHALEYVYNHPDETKAKTHIARQWCEENSWGKRESEWQQLLLTIKNRQNA